MAVGAGSSHRTIDNIDNTAFTCGSFMAFGTGKRGVGAIKLEARVAIMFKYKLAPAVGDMAAVTGRRFLS